MTEEYQFTRFDKFIIFLIKIKILAKCLWLFIIHGFSTYAVLEHIDNQMISIKRQLWKIKTTPDSPPES